MSCPVGSTVGVIGNSIYSVDVIFIEILGEGDEPKTEDFKF